MMVPNPHWYKQNADVYHYHDRVLALKLLSMSGWFVLLYRGFHAKKSAWLMGLGLFLLLAGIVAGLIWKGHEGGHIEIRYHHFSFYRGDKLVVHESMRDLVSLEPTMKGEKLQFHTALFENGSSAKIYSNLENHDVLIARLQSYLLQTA